MLQERVVVVAVVEGDEEIRLGSQRERTDVLVVEIAGERSEIGIARAVSDVDAAARNRVA